MKIWVDADACPTVIKEILYRAANRVEIQTILVANQFLKTPASPFIKTVQVNAGFDVADNYIVQWLEAEDIVITADIPLAAEVVEKGAHGINPRGTLYTKQNIKQTLGMRNFMEEMRNTGQVSGGPPPLNAKDKQQFANTLDRLLAKHIRA
jgi:uncharacterized protein YaiI (UPF0178 family)